MSPSLPLLLIVLTWMSPISHSHPFSFGELLNLGFQHQQFPCFRFKREVVPASNLSILHSEDLECNSKEVKEIIKKNIVPEITASKEGIYQDLATKMGGQWTVLCQEIQLNQSLPVFATRSPLFCAEKTTNIVCLAAEF